MSTTTSRPLRQSGYRGWILTTLFILICGVTPALAATSWESVPVTSWAETAMPAGWILMTEYNETSNPDYATISAVSPDWTTRLTGILNHTHQEMTRGEIREFQSRQMSQRGFRICKTKDPVISEKDGVSSYQQTYVRGTEDAAVIGTSDHPGWGQIHFILVMEGPPAVSEYYDLLPREISDHLVPVQETG